MAPLHTFHGMREYANAEKALYIDARIPSNSMRLYVGASAGILGRVNDDLDLRKLNAIVGSAIKALAESGADDELIGAFAATHREKVSKILGRPEEALQPPDLQEIVTQAVSHALEVVGVAQKVKSNTTTRVNVVIAGKRTTVTIQKETIGKLAQVRGGGRQAKAFIQEVALSSPPDVANRSNWVEARLQNFLSFSPKAASSAEMRH